MFRYPKLGGVDATLELLLWSFFQDAGFATNFGMTAEMFFRSVTVKGKRGQGWQERRTRVARENCGMFHAMLSVAFFWDHHCF